MCWYRSASVAISARPVEIRYLDMRSLNGKIEVVAPISAPMLQIVPIPYMEIVVS